MANKKRIEEIFVAVRNKVAKNSSLPKTVKKDFTWEIAKETGKLVLYPKKS